MVYKPTTTQLQINLQNRLGIVSPSPLQPIEFKDNTSEDTTFYVKRDDRIHPIVSGNKWRKLSPVITKLYTNLADTPPKLMSFGGGYSNHLHALGYCCYLLGWPFVACVRGDYSNNLTPMLKDLTSWHTKIVWMNKLDYRRKNDDSFIKALTQQYCAEHVIPEGGSHADSLEGMATLISELPAEIDAIVCPVASGGTMAGLIQAITKSKRDIAVLGIAVLKGQDYLEELVQSLLANKSLSINIEHRFHFGGYAKRDATLTEFCQEFTQRHNMPIEPVYSGKLFFGVTQLISEGYFDQYRHVVILHTGGLQGARQTS